MSTKLMDNLPNVYINYKPSNPGVPFPKINFTSFYSNRNQNKEEIKHQNEVKEKKTKEKRCRKLFTKEEDEKIKELTEKYGTKQWNIIAQFIEGRTPKQCRDRYCNYLFPGIFNGEWSTEEDELLMNLYNKYGPRWTTLQRSFPYRSANTIKNRWDFFLCRQFNENNSQILTNKNNYNNNNNNNDNNNNKKDHNDNDKEEKDNETNEIRTDILFENTIEDFSNIFENNFKEEPFEIIQDDNIFEITNEWY